MSSITVPFSLEPNKTLKRSLHTHMATTISRRVQCDSSKLESYGKDMDKAIKLLMLNRAHQIKPSLVSLANCVHIYKEWEFNFYDVYTADPRLAMWVGHLFYCLSEKARLAYTYTCRQP
jgi:hypothetical protein